MSERSTGWEDKVRQGLFAEEVFSEQMKQSVLGAVNRRRSSSLFLPWKQILGSVMLVAAAWLVAVNWPSDNASPSVAGSSDAASPESAGLPVSFEPLAAKDWERGQPTYGEDPNILPGLSNKFNPLSNESNERINQIPFSDIQLIEQRPIEGFGMALRYTLKPGSTAPHVLPNNGAYFGFTVNGSTEPDTLYHYGTGHMYDLKFSMTRLFGQEALKIEQTVCRTDGETCVWYFRKDEHGQVASFMQLDASSYERDWDGDGKEEAIVATRKQNQIYVFKEQDGRLLWTSIRDALQAGPNDALQYDDGLGVFRFLSAGGVVETYRLQGEPESLVRVSGNSGL